MISACVTPNFGILASDSAMFDTRQSKMSFETMKLFFTTKYLVTFIGTPVYFAKIDRSKLDGDLPTVCLYMEDYLKKMKPEVEKILKSEIADSDENKPNICLFILGIAKKLPTLVQFNSELNFKPKYLYSSDKPKFSTIYFGDDNPEKKKIFIESREFMEHKTHKLAKRGIDLTPGVLAEVMTRGIYKKADLEQAIGPRKKYAGGTVNLAGMHNTGLIFQLSGMVAL